MESHKNPWFQTPKKFYTILNPHDPHDIFRIFDKTTL